MPKTKQIGYYSDAYKLEFVLPKYNMYRRILATMLADDFVRPGVYTRDAGASTWPGCCCARTHSASSRRLMDGERSRHG